MHRSSYRKRTIAGFLKSLNISNPNGAPKKAENLDDLIERTCKRCHKQFDPVNARQRVCNVCKSEIGRNSRKDKPGKTGQGSPAVIAQNPHDTAYYGATPATH